jgi:hypothetical protein
MGFLRKRAMQPILFAIVDVEYDVSLSRRTTKRFNQLQQCHRTNSIVSCTWCGRNRIVVRGNKDFECVGVIAGPTDSEGAAYQEEGRSFHEHELGC